MIWSLRPAPVALVSDPASRRGPGVVDFRGVCESMYIHVYEYIYIYISIYTYIHTQKERGRINRLCKV